MASTGTCQLCRRPVPTRAVVFRQNIGVVLLRLSKKIEGPLCWNCIDSTFCETTLTTLVAGWWGLKSFFVTPFVLVSNVAEYVEACRSPDLRDPSPPRPSAKARVAVGAVAAVGLAGTVTLVSILQLFDSSPRSARSQPASTGAAGLRDAEKKYSPTPEKPRSATLRRRSAMPFRSRRSWHCCARSLSVVTATRARCHFRRVSF